MIGCDEVGRGAIAGPVAVGAVRRGCLGRRASDWPARLEDAEREAARGARSAGRGLGAAALPSVSPPRARSMSSGSWSRSASPASARSCSCTSSEHPSPEQRAAAGRLYDWLTPVLKSPLRVRTRVKADRDCASVAAASVVAKVHRDRMMIGYDAEYPGLRLVGQQGLRLGRALRRHRRTRAVRAAPDDLAARRAPLWTSHAALVGRRNRLNPAWKKTSSKTTTARSSWPCTANTGMWCRSSATSSRRSAGSTSPTRSPSSVATPSTTSTSSSP